MYYSTKFSKCRIIHKASAGGGGAASAGGGGAASAGGGGAHSNHINETS